MLIFVGIYLVLSCTLGVVLGRMIKYGTSVPSTEANQGRLAVPHVFERGQESQFATPLRTYYQ